MQAVRMTLGRLPARFRRSANARITGLNCLALKAAMYSARRTDPRPPQIDRWPRNWPLSRLKGARPTREAICWRLSFPNSGSSATSDALVAGPTPGTDCSNSDWLRQSSLSAIRRAISASSVLQLLAQQVEHVSDAFRGRLDRRLLQAIGFRGPQRQQLPAPHHQGRQFLLFFRRFPVEARLNMLGVNRQRAGIDRIALGQHANAMRESTNLTRIGDRRSVSGSRQLRGQSTFEPTAGLHHDQTVRMPGQLGHQFRDALVVVRAHHARARGQDPDVELGLRDIDTHKGNDRVLCGTVHGVVPVLLMRARDGRGPAAALAAVRAKSTRPARITLGGGVAAPAHNRSLAGEFFLGLLRSSPRKILH